MMSAVKDLCAFLPLGLSFNITLFSFIPAMGRAAAFSGYFLDTLRVAHSPQGVRYEEEYPERIPRLPLAPRRAILLHFFIPLASFLFIIFLFLALALKGRKRKRIKKTPKGRKNKRIALRARRVKG